MLAPEGATLRTSTCVYCFADGLRRPVKMNYSSHRFTIAVLASFIFDCYVRDRLKPPCREDLTLGWMRDFTPVHALRCGHSGLNMRRDLK